MEVRFHPESDQRGLEVAAQEYQQVWDAEASHITGVLEQISSFHFAERWFNALVYPGPASAFPLRFSARPGAMIKKASIVHELGHRLLAAHGLQSRRLLDEAAQLEDHRRLDLVLFDTWADLWGEDFARNAVEWESKLRPMYGKAWELALSLTREQRLRAFEELRRGPGA